MATIKPIEAASVHRIQSGQVIVDLCSVVKELVENSLDAEATSVEVRFKNQGLDAIEVADNGAGIARDDYDTVALKHYTSKLRNYDDLAELDTFGFRGEALSSLCALSDVHIVTAQEHEAPKATRLDFAQSGALKESSTVAAQKGTSVYVETIFKNLPVRRQELTRNIKREYNKVLNLLQAYACISTVARVVVSNVAAKGKKSIVFATKAKQTTRENIANVFGMKTIAALIPLDVAFELQPSARGSKPSQVRVSGHVSRPTVGEGRHMADRQMFFVNNRPCALPQVAKVINEVYKTYNLTQSPFIFANMELDTNAYDVNVSPDKRTILLHEQGALLESLRSSLLELFESHQQSVPQASPSQSGNIPSAFRRANASMVQADTPSEAEPAAEVKSTLPLDLRSRFLSSIPDSPGDHARTVLEPVAQGAPQGTQQPPSQDAEISTVSTSGQIPTPSTMTGVSVGSLTRPRHTSTGKEQEQEASLFISDDEDPPPQQRRLGAEAASVTSPRNSQTGLRERHSGDATQESSIPSARTSPVKSAPGVVTSAFDRMRPLRPPLQEATITIGDQTTTKIIGGSVKSGWGYVSKVRSRTGRHGGKPSFQNSLKNFLAPGTQVSDNESSDEEEGDGQESRNRSGDKVDGPEQVDTASISRPVADSESEPDALTDPPSPNRAHADDSEPAAMTAAETGQGSSDDEYVDEEAHRAKEEARVAQLIRDAEEQVERSAPKAVKRIDRIMKGSHRHATAQLQLPIVIETEQVLEQAVQLDANMKELRSRRKKEHRSAMDLDISAEERLTLAVAKDDFKSMRIAGQFNLGFIIASRPPTDNEKSDDELFIIDQHASDEKFNFERLQATTMVQNQTLVNSQRLDLTAVEEEIILDNEETLLKNGFEVSIDQSGDYPVGKRCTLVSLPMSREVTFSAGDLEELLALLAESPTIPSYQTALPETSSDTPRLLREPSTFSTPVIRPSAVRKMFAMRACRSSIMIGRTLSYKQMRGLVDNMGKMDKPWNCPHGRPTMRHLYSFGKWQSWSEGDGVTGMAEDEDFYGTRLGNGSKVDWAKWLGGQSEVDDSTQEEEEGNDDDIGDIGDIDEEEEEEEGRTKMSQASEDEMVDDTEMEDEDEI